MKIGEKIKQRRTELKWSQRELAAKMGYNHSTITRIETGKIDIPQSRIVQFSEVLGVSVAYLMSWEEVEKNNDIISDTVVKMRTDDEFFSLVECLLSLDNEKLSIIMQTALAFKK
jgi:transcriptional regulator with XRE-family HTH domain